MLPRVPIYPVEGFESLKMIGGKPLKVKTKTKKTTEPLVVVLIWSNPSPAFQANPSPAFHFHPPLYHLIIWDKIIAFW